MDETTINNVYGRTYVSMKHLLLELEIHFEFIRFRKLRMTESELVYMLEEILGTRKGDL